MVDDINYETRTITLRGPENNTETLTVGPQAKRFNEVKKGDHLKVRVALAVAARRG